MVRAHCPGGPLIQMACWNRVRRALGGRGPRGSRKRWGTDLRTAALQFSLRDPRLAFTVVGPSHPDRLDGLLADAEAELPEAFWEEAESTVPTPEHWLDPPA